MRIFDRPLATHLFTAGLALAGLLILWFLEPIAQGFLEVATRFDKDGSVSHPDWLDRPILTAAVLLLLYAVLRGAFEANAGQTLEGWVLAGAGARQVRRLVLGATFAGLPLLFAAFAYAVTHPAFWATYYREDQVFENATALLLTGGGLMLFAARSLLRIPLRWRRTGAITAAAMGVASIFLGLEEVSYGQRIFGWGTPERMGEVNLQSETNLHNYWTHDIQATIAWLAAGVMLAGISAAVFLRRFWRNPWTAFLPDQGFLPYGAALLLLASHGGFHEPLEQAVALFAALYGYQIAAASYRAGAGDASAQ